jgi:formylglycine-generating enzyme required for sulfatase activity
VIVLQHWNASFVDTELLQVRVFLASPGDVADERALARTVLNRLEAYPGFDGRVVIREVSWDSPGASTPLPAHLTPQEAIRRGLPKPSECDIVLVMLWSRMGTPLPAAERKKDGSSFTSGTEWEYLDAVEHAAQHGQPIVLAYRRMEKVPVDLDAPDLDERRAQRLKVQRFFDAFRNPDGSLRWSYHEYDGPTDFEKLLETHLRDVVWKRYEEWAHAHAPEPDARPSPQPPIARWKGSPYRGLLAFTATEASIFFGRGFEIDGLVRRLSAGSRFIAVIGDSGSGKSSLVAAGLQPRLKPHAVVGVEQWAWVRFTPGEVGDDPFMALAVGLERAFPNRQLVPRELATRLHTEADALAQIASAALAESGATAQLLLYVDQFEELFTLAAEQHRTPFAQLVASAAATDRIRVVITMRADFYSHCTRWDSLTRLLREGSFPVGVPGVTTLAEMITRPAQAAGLEFDDGLVDRIIAGAGTGIGALPLMQFALSKLYDGRVGNRLTNEAYDAMGGVEGAIEAHAEATVQQDGRAIADTTFNAMFSELVTVNTEGAIVRQRADLDSFAPDVRVWVDRLVTARLLVAGMGGKVEVAHEALLQHWDRLCRWAQVNRELLLWRQRIRADVSDWTEKRDPLLLLRGLRLAEAERWISERPADLSDRETAFVTASLAARAAEHRSKRARRLVGVGVGAIALTAFVTYGPRAYNQWKMRQPIVPDMVVIPPGEFTMGAADDDLSAKPAEKPAHRVVIGRKFAIGRYEVTVAEYQRCVNADVCFGGGPGLAQEPVAFVTWDDAVTYARWLSGTTGKSFRLPTEAEWEYAARAGTSTAWWWGDELGSDRVNCRGCPGAWEHKRVAPVGSFQPNPFGLYDTAGNLVERVQDCWHDSYEGAPSDGSAWTEAPNEPACKERVVRGGSWNKPATDSRSTSRFPGGGGAAGGRTVTAGFRLAEDLP